MPDCVIRDWGDIPSNIYISKKVDDLGKTKFKYNRESTWKKTHKQKIPQVRKPDINDENYPYKKYLHCAGCGSILTRHYQGTNKKVVWICSGYKHKGKVFCSGVRLPDEVVRRASEKITHDIYIRKENINNKEFIDNLKQYDKLVNETYDKNIIVNAEKQILSRYEELVIRNE